jgi:superfamily I DNA/RNA helicase
MNVARTTDVDEYSAAVECGLGEFVVITGEAGTGKSTALIARALRAAEGLGSGERAVLSATGECAARRFAGEYATVPGLQCATLGEVAFDLLVALGPATPSPALIDDVRAEELFAHAGASLFSLEWDEFLSAEIDPEITGMRAPERFAGVAYRLIRKLRMAGLSPADFEAAAMKGATAFYGRPPNFANPELIQRTPAKYRDSLRLDASELARQYTREMDLSRVIARLYRAYLERIAERGCLTAIDALCAASDMLEAQAEVREAARRRFRFAFVDDAQDLTRADLRFLRALFGDLLADVTLAGDPEQRTLAFAGPRAEGVLDAAGRRFVLREQRRAEPQLASEIRAILVSGGVRNQDPSGSAVVHRAATMRAEAAYVANAVATSIARGTAPRDIAVIARSLRCVDEYIGALLDREIPVDPAGNGSLFAFADVEDALAALWSVADPLRNDWLLRNLEAPWLNLSDATIAILCGEPADAQTPLFELTSEDAEDDRRWDRRRDFRLAWNVLRGDRDSELSMPARERLEAFRFERRRWLEREPELGLPAFARIVLSDTVLASQVSDARMRLRRCLVERLLEELGRFAARRPRATLHDYLLHAEHVAQADDDLLFVAPYDREAVALLSVEAAKGREFAEVFVVDVRSGAFPRYYVPEAFNFTPKFGMIAKENVGDAATAARTAKFTYLQYKMNVATRYYDEERRALYSAASRARRRLSISASGRPTRGLSAPEFLEELRTAYSEA